MSTLSLVLIAIATAVFGLGALSLLRWRERKRLVYARQVVSHTDSISLLAGLGEALSPWISSPMLNFIATSIQFHHRSLEALAAPENRRVIEAVNSALQWTQTNRPAKKKLPSDSAQAQALRDHVRNLLTCLKEAYTEHLLNASDAKILLAEAKVLNINISLGVLRGKAEVAAQLSNHFQAVHYYKKALELLTQLPQLPDDLIPAMEDIRTKITKHEQLKEENKTGNRLEAEAALLSDEDNSWKKKRYDMD